MIHDERRKFLARKPMAAAPSNEMQVKTTTAAAAAHQSQRCHGRGAQITTRMSA